MKLLLASVVILIIIIVGIFFNSHYVTAAIDRLIIRAEVLAPRDPLPYEDVKTLYADWQRAERYFNLTVSHSDLMEIDAQFATLLGACRADDREEFLIARERLSHALLHLRDTTDYGFDDIF